MPKEKDTQKESTEASVAQETALENFEWDEGGGDFFGIDDSAIEKEDVVPVKKEDEEEDVSKTKEEEEDNEEEESFFGLDEEDIKSGEEDDNEEITPKNKTEEDLNSYAEKLKENGIFQNIEIPEEELTEDKFIELQDLEIESRVDEAFEGFFKEMDDDGAAFLKHKKNGGSTEDFFKVYGTTSELPEGDLDDEQYQEKVSRYYYGQVEGDSTEDIDDKIEWLRDTGKLEKYSQKFDLKIKEKETKDKEDLVKANKAAEKVSDANKKAFANSVQEALDNTDQVDNFTFTKESKKSLLPFITKPTVKIGPNKYITGMQSRLSTALKNPEKMLVLAQLLQNDFDVSTIIQNATTVKTKKLKADIQRKKSVKPSSSGRTGHKRSLADVNF